MHVISWLGAKTEEYIQSERASQQWSFRLYCFDRRKTRAWIPRSPIVGKEKLLKVFGSQALLYRLGLLGGGVHGRYLCVGEQIGGQQALLCHPT